MPYKCPIKRKEYMKTYNANRQEDRKEQKRLWYENNKEEILKKQKEYNKKNYVPKIRKPAMSRTEYQRRHNKSWFAKCRYCKQNNKIVNSAARIMAFKATYTECQNCGSSKNLHVDHDHDTGLIRGILCHSCNIKDVFAGRKEVL